MRWWTWLPLAGLLGEVRVTGELDGVEGRTNDLEDLETCPPPGPDGAELFARTWTLGDPRAALGDGLGPKFNDRSCAACHIQGGPGGAGPNNKNVRLGLDRRRRTTVEHRFDLGPRRGDRGFQSSPSSAPVPAPVPAPLSLPERRSGGFLRFSMLDDLGVSRIERSTPALFGAGLIDTIPDGDLVVQEALGVPGAPWITGRVGRDPSGRVTRFGWKGGTASLADFVEAACANELGLQTAAVDQPGGGAPGPDMTDAELDALVGFVRALPPPTRIEVPGAAAGEALFTEVGCADCHTPDLGEVEGLYSDLLLHDLGDQLVDAASGYMGAALAAPSFADAAAAAEWRTPPLWGLRDSAPYLHDGRADTIAQAVEAHDGEAAPARSAWHRLGPDQREAMEAFLASLVAPAPAGSAVDQDVLASATLPR